MTHAKATARSQKDLNSYVAARITHQLHIVMTFREQYAGKAGEYATSILHEAPSKHCDPLQRRRY